MVEKKQESEDPFASFVDILREMVDAGYGFEDIMKTMQDLGLSEAEAELLVEMNVEKQLPKLSGKIEKIVKDKVEKHVLALKERLKRRVESKRRRIQKELEMIHVQVGKSLREEAPEKEPVFERRYYDYLMMLNQADLERKELIAFLLEIENSKMSRKTRSRAKNAIHALQEL